MNQWFRRLVLFLAALSVGGLEIALIRSQFGERAEVFSSEVWFKARGPVPPPDDVVIVALDEASYAELGIRFDEAWPRALHAKMLEELRRHGVRRVAMDILFLQASPDNEIDLSLAQAMQSVPTVIGADTGSREQWLGGQRFEITELLEPAPLFASAAEKVALVKMPEDQGYARRFTIESSDVTTGFPAMYEAASGRTSGLVELPRQNDLLWYYGPPGTIRTYSYHVLLGDSKLPADALKDKIVFIGLMLRTALGPEQKDAFRVPVSSDFMFGVEIHATATANLLRQEWIRRAPPGSEHLSLFLGAVLLALLIFFLPPQWSGLIVVGGAACWALGAYLCFLNRLFIPGATLCFITAPVTYMVSTLYYYLTTHRERRKVEKAFTLYLPREMAKQMRDSPEALQLGGRMVRATALFTDLASFTPIAESMQPLEVANMLNDYFTVVARVIFANHGTLIKFLGDAVFAIYGAPIAMADHPAFACQTALGIQEAIRAFNAQGKYPELVTRIGIASGDMVVGNLGAVDRFDYTAIGDTVNFAARLESLNKHFGTRIIVSAAAAAGLNGKVQPVKLAKAQVVGKSEASELYTLNDGSLSGSMLELWTAALADFWNGERPRAARALIQIQREAGLLSGVAALYLKAVAGANTGAVRFTPEGELVLSEK